jgi:dextranase
MGYAAVYAVGGVDWTQWQHAGLYTAEGEPHRFTDDLLLIVDPANPEWMKHFSADLRASVVAAGFDGFHLDSYGWPKRAYRVDGSVADLNEGFATLLEHLRDEVPDARLLFNNVNDFPTWSTARTRQDGTYIEVWAPHTTLGHVGGLVERARAFNPRRVPVIAAYLTAYRDHPSEVAARTARLTMATIFSHGGTHLLNGEGNRVLIDPYYPTNHLAAPSTQDMMRRWYDFLVRHGDLLFDPGAVDVTRSYTGGINEDLVLGGDVPFTTDPEPGAVWVRVVRTRLGLVLHLINLVDQAETGWDRPKGAVTPVTGASLKALRTLAAGTPLHADPDASAALSPLTVAADGRYDVIALPPLGTWTMVVLPDPQGWDA